MPHVLVGTLVGPQRDRVRTLALWSGGAFAPEMEYVLAGTPCHDATTSLSCFFGSDVQARFPEDRDLVALGAKLSELVGWLPSFSSRRP